MDLGPHAAFIWLCYGAAGLVLSLVVVALWLEGNRLARVLAGLEARGVRRVSGSPPDATEA